MLPLKFLAFLFIVLYSLFFIPRSAFAQGYSLNTNPDVPQNLHTYTQTAIISLAAAISCQLTGFDPTNPQGGRCLGIDPQTGKIGYVEGGGGAIGIVGNFIAASFYIPVNTHDYGSYLASNFGISKRTYAAGAGGTGGSLENTQGAAQESAAPDTSLGYNLLSPTIDLWRVFRNLTYLVFIILFVVIGLGIMFRIKIDPRTVMTIQNQIPKIIMAIVFVTLSYAIAGLFIDMMYVLIYLIASIFAQQGIDPSPAFSSNPFEAAGGLGGMSGIASGAAKSIGAIVAQIFDGSIGKTIGTVVTGIITGAGASSVGGLAGTLMKGSAMAGKFGLIGGAIGLAGGIGLSLLVGGNNMIGLAAGVVAYLVIIIAIFSALLRLWFVLIKSYIYILINVVFAPLYIAYGLIPGKSGIGNWVKSMVANLSVFPATITMFLLGQTFMSRLTNCADCAPGLTPFAPPLVGDFTDPTKFSALIGLGIILLTPEVANMIRDALKAPDFKYTTSLGRSLGVGAGVATAGPRQAWHTLMREPRYLGDPGGFGRQKLTELQQSNKVIGRILHWTGFHGSGTGQPGH